MLASIVPHCLVDDCYNCPNAVLDYRGEEVHSLICDTCFHHPGPPYLSFLWRGLISFPHASATENRVSKHPPSFLSTMDDYSASNANGTRTKCWQSTPSNIHGISPSVERLHRLHGTSLLLDVATILRIPPSTYATSCTIFHRFFHRHSLTKYDVWSAAMGSILLATKVEEEHRSVQSIIATFAHIYRRRRLRYNDDMSNFSYGAADCETHDAATLTHDEKENMLRSVRPMPPSGPIYAEWKDTIMTMETVILAALGFTLHWISDSHPHKFILYFARVLELDGGEGDDNNKEGAVVAQTAWEYCNDSCRIDLCVRYDPEVIACAAILMSVCDHNVDLPLLPRPWWEAFIGINQSVNLSTVCNAILATQGGGDDVNDLDIRRARYAFIPSLLVNGPSFNDPPDSYLWVS